jgi:hypothetical protein
MIALACVILVLSGIVLMIATGVGPFSRDPWEQYHISFRKRPAWQQRLLVIPSILIAIACSLTIIGVFS